MVYRSRPISKFGWRNPWSLRSRAGIAPRRVRRQAKDFARRRCSGTRLNTLSKSSTPRVVLLSLLRMVSVAFPPSTSGFGVDIFGAERPVMGDKDRPCPADSQNIVSGLRSGSVAAEYVAPSAPLWVALVPDRLASWLPERRRKRV